MNATPRPLAVLYMLLGIPLSWWLWYKRLYGAAKADSAFGFVWFFVWFAVHTAFCIWAAIGEWAARGPHTSVSAGPGWEASTSSVWGKPDRACGCVDGEGSRRQAEVCSVRYVARRPCSQREGPPGLEGRTDKKD